MYKRILVLVVLFSFFANAQEDNIHQRSTTYEWPAEPEVLEKLDKWQDLKFGMIIHWGLYAVPGITESWPLCSEDWINRPDSLNYNQFKNWYWGLNKQFNPTKFNPEQWAKSAKNAGMKYLVFTTKHHDGFTMFNSKETDYTIAKGPFKDNPKADVAKYVFDAFRNEGMMIGAYFSKPDWHSQDFWWDKYATPNRNVNYDIRKFPDKWNNFKSFAKNQIAELTSGAYGNIDILWLDGGWVRPPETVNDEVLSWGAPIPDFDQSIDIPGISKMARETQPGMLVVDRTVHGAFENYQTPERSVPDHQLPNPWESCITLGNAWGYTPNDKLKSPTKVIHLLTEIVAKGGSLLLGIGPKPDGTLRQGDIDRMAKIGEWLNVNGKAIYETRSAKHYQDGNTYFTAAKDGKLYALVNIEEGNKVPTTITWTGNSPKKRSVIKLISSGQKVKWTQRGDKVTITMPESFITKNPNYPALTFEFTPAK